MALTTGCIPSSVRSSTDSYILLNTCGTSANWMERLFSDFIPVGVSTVSGTFDGPSPAVLLDPSPWSLAGDGSSATVSTEQEVLPRRNLKLRVESLRVCMYETTYMH